jgi:hypothetical protein
MIDEQLAHGAGRYGEEVMAVFARHPARTREPEVGFVDNGRRLQLVPRALVREETPRDRA